MGLDLIARRPTRFPAEGKAWANVLLANAMAVRQEFHHPFARFTAPILSISFEDDDINTKNGIDFLHSSYPNVTRRHIVPRDAGQSRIGHFGFFNERCRDPLWLDALAWLKEKTGVRDMFPAGTTGERQTCL